MAHALLFGRIEGIRYKENSAIVTLSEYMGGYRKKDGTIVEEDILTYRIAFKAYFKKYLASYFSEGNLVWVKAMMLPYAKNGEGKVCEGYTLIGQAIDIASYPKSGLRQERKRIKESQENSEMTPNLEGFNQDDFN